MRVSCALVCEACRINCPVENSMSFRAKAPGKQLARGFVGVTYVDDMFRFPPRGDKRGQARHALIEISLTEVEIT